MTLVFEDHFLFHGNRDEWPSVRLVRAEAAIGSYLETPIVSSSPLASCQRKHVNASKNVASARINRTESSQRIVAIRVAANCGPTGMKPAETFLEPLQTREQKLRKRILLRTRNHEFRIKSQDTSIFDIPCSVFNIQKRPKVSVIWLTPTARRFSNCYFGVRLGH